MGLKKMSRPGDVFMKEASWSLVVGSLPNQMEPTGIVVPKYSNTLVCKIFGKTTSSWSQGMRSWCGVATLSGGTQLSWSYQLR